MALNFADLKKANNATTVTLAKDTDVKSELQIATESQILMTETTENIRKELVNSPEIDRLTSTINIQDMNTIVKFGAEAAEAVSSASDQVLRSVNMSQVDDSNRMLTALANIMQKFDAKELTDEKKGLFANLRKQVEKILEKYHTMGDEVDKIYIELKGYEQDIEDSNKKLSLMYESNIEYYKTLCLYILAGEQACREIDAYIAQRKAELEGEDSGVAAMDMQTLAQVQSMMEQRVLDLKIAENVAMQSIPMLKAMEFSNLNLVRKINSAFIITMPVFKQALAQAVMLKRQRIQADALSVLDKKTNELLLKNAKNTVEQTKMIAQMANGSSIKVETLEQTWKTIVQGIEDTRRIQEEAKVKRKEDSARLEKLKEDYYSKMARK